MYVFVCVCVFACTGCTGNMGHIGSVYPDGPRKWEERLMKLEGATPKECLQLWAPGCSRLAASELPSVSKDSRGGHMRLRVDRGLLLMVIVLSPP